MQLDQCALHGFVDRGGQGACRRFYRISVRDVFANQCVRGKPFEKDASEIQRRGSDAS